MAHRHDHAHDHAHGHDHDHHPAVSGNERRVLWALGVTAVFFVAELVGGVISGSLALLADAGHMLTDGLALALAWAAFRVSRRPHDGGRTYGYHRFQVLAAFANAIGLVAIVVWIVVEAVNRLAAPMAIMGETMMAVAIAGLIANIVVFFILQSGETENLNMQGALAHVIGDLLGSVGAIGAAVVILWTGWTPIDPILSIFVAVLILRSAWRLLRRSAHILLEGTPDWLDIEELRADLCDASPDIEDIHHVHAWSLTAERPLLTLHAVVRPGADHAEVLGRIKDCLLANYGIDHSTVQIEIGDCPDDAAVAVAE